MNDQIIIIEDKAIIALDIKTYLNKNGYDNALSFLNGDKAWEYLDENKPDLVLIDVMLHSEVTGIEIAKKLKKLAIPFIFISAFSNPVQYQEAVELSPVAIFHKPVNLAEILLVIKKILSKHKIHNQNNNKIKSYH